MVPGFKKFLQHESASGIILLVTSVCAFLAANSPVAEHYYGFLHTKIGRLGKHEWDIHFLINDLLMVVFFFLVGLEIKREFLVGELSTRKQALLPVIAAAGGMILPALIYLAISSDPLATRGWGVAVATDIAFSLGIYSLLGNRVPATLKIFLAAFAIADDLGAVIVIALFYTTSLDFNAGVTALLGLVILFGCNRVGLKSWAIYLLMSVVVWWFTLQSGVHATVAGVLCAAMIPLADIHKYEHALSKLVSFWIMPVFAFANAGVTLGSGISVIPPAETSLAVLLGLFFGKQIGIFSAVLGALKLGLVELPRGANKIHIYGVACLGGVGFTMSLFVASLAFNDQLHMDQAKLGILLGSFLSGIWGYLVLRFFSNK
ncbi:Na+/H+ antiporter NhaA [bacterium]|nr:Na+/H+ antiporter NhaA [bacterium]